MTGIESSQSVTQKMGLFISSTMVFSSDKAKEKLDGDISNLRKPSKTMENID
jgi:hypothetical protein